MDLTEDGTKQTEDDITLEQENVAAEEKEYGTSYQGIVWIRSYENTRWQDMRNMEITRVSYYVTRI